MGGSKAKLVLYSSYCTARCETCYILITENRICKSRTTRSDLNCFLEPVQRWIRQEMLENNIKFILIWLDFLNIPKLVCLMVACEYNKEILYTS